MVPVHRRGFLAVAATVLATPVASSRLAEIPVTLVTSAAVSPVVQTAVAPPVLPAAVRAAPAPVLAPAIPTPITPAPTTPTIAALPRWQRYAVAGPGGSGRPAITIVVDDLGVVHPATERVVAMGGPLTLSWFPFARHLPEQVAAAALHGHEMTLHMPMQNYGLTTAWTGPDPLRVDLPPEVNLARLRAAIAAVPSTVGLNNHMGSVATRDPALMALVAQECKAHDMLFLDSVVVTHSCGYSAARDAGVPAAARDIFIDHSSNPREIAEQLALIEVHARKYGNVIAIGHPWRNTVTALEEWLPTLAAKGFDLWPLSAMVALRNGIKMPATIPA